MKIMNRQILITGIVLLCSLIFFELFDIDIWSQDYLYDFPQHDWYLERNNKMVSFLFYDGIKKIYYAFIILSISSLLLFRKTSVIRNYQQGLMVVCLSTVLVPLTVGILKATTNVPCPRNITRYGGSDLYVKILGKYPDSFEQIKKARCFPAGHASGGFALLSLYFLFKRRRNKIIALVTATLTGWATGAYKILIGDHFFSHTVITMILAWFIILLIVKIKALFGKNIMPPFNAV